MRVIFILFFVLAATFSKAQIGNSLELDGASCLELGDLDVSGNKITVECLMYSRIVDSGGGGTCMIGKFDGPGNVNYFLQHVGFEAKTQSGQYLVQPYPAPRTNRWFHYAAVYDGQNIMVYENFCLMKTVPVTGLMHQNDLQAVIGATSNRVSQAPRFFSGYLDEVRIWKEARTQAQLEQFHLNVPNPLSEPNLVAYYKFENGFQNEMGTGFNGTPIGNPVIVNANFTGIVLLDFNANVIVPSCNSNADGKLVVSSTYPYGQIAYALDAENYQGGTLTYNNVSPGTHTIKAISDLGCPVIKTFVMPTNDMVTVAATNNSPVCDQAPLELYGNVSGDPNNVSFQWTKNGGGYSSTQQNPIINPSAPSDGGVYSLTVKQYFPTGDSCVKTVTTNVQASTTPGKANAGPDINTCEGYDVTLDGSSLTANVNYHWTGPNGFTSTVSDPQIQNLADRDTGNYILLTDLGGCNGTPDTAHVAIVGSPKPFLGPDSIYCTGDALQLYTGAWSSYLWSDGSKGAVLNVTQPGTYWIEVSNEDGCFGSDTLTLVDFCPFEIFVPNSFTPDGDGYNETFFIVANNVVNFDLRIFNRWGEEVYVSSNVNQAWDGKYKGSLVEQGVYPFKIKLGYVDETGSVKKIEKYGKILILR